MIAPDTLAGIVSAHGLTLLLPLSILEGPVVTVLAGWLSSLGLLDLRAVLGVAVLGDVLGDLLLYGLGRRVLPLLSRGWRRRLGLSAGRMAQLVRHFRDRGPRTLVLAKLTHSVGAPVLVAAGMARMPVLPFMLANLFAAVPKTLLLVGLGWTFGAAWAEVGDWIGRASLLLAIGVIGWLCLRRCRPPQEAEG